MNTKNRLVNLGIITLILLLASSCKNANYLYIEPKPVVTVKQQAKAVSAEYTIKNLEGNNKVDMLWVIDNSASMSAYQKSVADNTNLFINTLAQNTTLDWNLGLISTDITNPPYIGFTPTTELNSRTVKPVDLFVNAVSKLGVGGDGREKTYDPIMAVLKKYPNFLRTNAYLVIILVSDAPEQSTAETVEFVKYLTSLKGSGDNILFYGILSPTDWCPIATDDAWEINGSKFQELSYQVKSKMYPICDSNFGQHLLDIGNDLVQIASHPKAYLASIPQVQTIKVIYKGVDIPGGPASYGGFWTYDSEINAVIFNDLSFAPGKDESVQIKYLPVEKN